MKKSIFALVFTVFAFSAMSPNAAFAGSIKPKWSCAATCRVVLKEPREVVEWGIAATGDTLAEAWTDMTLHCPGPTGYGVSADIVSYRVLSGSEPASISNSCARN